MCMANANTHHDGHGRFVRVIENAELDREAARLYQRFSSYSEVARVQGVEVSTVQRRVARALAGEPDDNIALARKVSLARLNAMAVIAQGIAEEEFLAHSNGRVVGIQDDQGHFVPLRDRGPNLAAVDRLRQIEDQRNRLLGTYAPVSARLEVVPTDVIERLIADNERLIAAAEAELGIGPSVPELLEGTSGEG